jgi:hypothetical protein
MPTSCRLAHHDTVLPCSNRSKLVTATPDLVEPYRCTMPGGYDARGKPPAFRTTMQNRAGKHLPCGDAPEEDRTDVRIGYCASGGGSLAHDRSRRASLPIDRRQTATGMSRQTAADCVTLGLSPLGSRLQSKGWSEGPRNRDAPQSKGWVPPSPANPRAAVAGTVARVGTRRRRSQGLDGPAAGAPARAHQLVHISASAEHVLRMFFAFIPAGIASRLLRHVCHRAGPLRSALAYRSGSRLVSRSWPGLTFLSPGFPVLP